MQIKAVVVTAALLVGSAVAAQAGTITNGLTFSVAPDIVGVTGHHFHSNSGGAFGNPPGKAEVGTFVGEDVRGLSEFDLAALPLAASAILTFDVFKAGGLFDGTNDTPFIGTISVLAYHGNNVEDIVDYEAVTVGTVGSFSTVGLAVGNTTSFDITSIFNTAVGLGWSSLGVRLQTTDAAGSHAWTFDTFQLTTTPAAPLPLAVWPGLMVLGALAAVRRRRRTSFNA